MLNRGGRHSKKGPPEWKLISTFHPEDDETIATHWTAKEQAVLKCVEDLEGGGGGWQAAGPKHGTYSSLRGTYTHKLKCASGTCYGCPAAIKIVDFVAPRKTEVWEAAGWPHTHTGPFLSKTGLPPALKKDIEAVVGKNPRITPTSLVTQMLEEKGWPAEFKQRIKVYLNNNRKNSPAMALG